MTSELSRAICIHGHFYQPPRENPWTETVELQESAAPWHDWNERITAECYGPNAQARILNEQGLLTDVVNNYAWTSFNFGPTLLSWMETQAPDTYGRILDADHESLARWGHGNALAQVYNHMMMPLANARDQETQIRWGIADFRRRFGRNPEGMWLPECGCNDDTIADLEQQGIRFIILEPGQSLRSRPLGDDTWQNTREQGLDPTRPYRCYVRDARGRKDLTRFVDIFFYDGPISRAVSFEDLLGNGERFSQRLTDAWNAERDHPQLIHIATDGESYGHHKTFGEMALAYSLQKGIPRRGFEITNYGTFLEVHPPDWEVELNLGPDDEGTSWSCCHGVARWRADCGCHTGGEPGWNQRWRTPLRDGLDALRDALIPIFESNGAALFDDVWEARNQYIDVILDRSSVSLEEFLSRTSTHSLSPDEQGIALQLLEMQRQAMLMYTSCGWFFSDLAGIETVQNLAYAARAAQLARAVTGTNAVDADMLEHLEKAHCNAKPKKSGSALYQSVSMAPDQVLRKVVNQFAVTALFAESPRQESRLFHYRISVDDLHHAQINTRVLLVGCVTVESGIVPGEVSYRFVLLFSSGRFRTWIQPVEQVAWSDADRADIVRDFTQSEDACIAFANARFGEETWSLRHLYKDERMRMLHRLLRQHLTGWHHTYVGLYESTKDIVRNALANGLDVPEDFKFIAVRALRRKFHDIVDTAPGPWPGSTYDRAFHSLLKEAGELQLNFDDIIPDNRLAGLLTERVQSIGRRYDDSEIAAVTSLLHLLREEACPVNTGPAQVEYLRLLQSVAAAKQPDAVSLTALQKLAELLDIDWQSVMKDTRQ
jgi:alpha-amylase/alpha-mannosidase (GH57 family)